VASVERPKLIIFDTLAGVRPDRNNKDNLYEGDYRALAELQSWTNEAGIGAMILHHTRKMEFRYLHDQPKERRSISGGVMSRSKRRQSFSTRLPAVGPFRATRKRCGCPRRGQKSSQQDRHKVDEPLTPSQIASLVTISEPAVRQRLGNLVENGQIIRVSRGRYVSAKRDDLLSAKPHHNRHNVTKSPKVTK
jgi:hypothetical protein